jgi:hypothetical protein
LSLRYAKKKNKKDFAVLCGFAPLRLIFTLRLFQHYIFIEREQRPVPEDEFSVLLA